MNKKNQYAIFVIFVVIILLILGFIFYRNSLINQNNTNNSNVNPVSNNIVEEDLAVTILISDPFGNSTEYTYEYTEGKSVLDVLKELDNSEDDLVVSYTEDATLGAYINNFNNYEIDESSQFWEFLVNAEASVVGISSYVVKPGDRIEFRVTDFN